MNNNNSNNELLTALTAEENKAVEIAEIADLAQGPKEESKNEGIDIFSTPIIPEEVYNNLPEPLKSACGVFTVDRERDVFLTAAFVVLSGMFHNVSGVYDQKTVFPNLFAMVVADAASGKGNATFAKQLAMPYHNAIMASTPSVVGTAPPPMKNLHFLPANSSSAAIIKHLENFNGRGTIFETEIDTVTATLKQDWAGYSDMLRKAFHHEPVSYLRKLNNEYAEIQKPQLSIFLSGTPGQVPLLIPSIENGLCSRFIFYAYGVPRVWKDVLPSVGKPNLTEYFKNLSEEVLSMVNAINSTQIVFKMTQGQWGELNKEFENRLRVITAFDSDAAGSVIRLGLITFRIAMLFTVIRAIKENSISGTITCTDIDFSNALTLSGVYLEHTLHMIETLPKSAPKKPNMVKLLNALPNEFTRKEAIRFGAKIGIGERIADEYLREMVGKQIEKTEKFGSYKKK